MVEKLYSEIFGEDSSEATRAEKSFPFENYAGLVQFCKDRVTRTEFVILMRCLRGKKSQALIGEELGVTRQTVNAAYHGAIKKLQREKDRFLLFLMPIADWIERIETLTTQNLELEKRNTLQETVIYNLTTKQETSDIGKFLETDIGKVGLSIRAENGLRRLGARTVRGMLGLTNSEIRHTRGLGIKSYNEILEKAAEFVARYPELTEITNLKRPS